MKRFVTNSDDSWNEGDKVDDSKWNQKLKKPNKTF
jgi:hypothetical protein